MDVLLSGECEVLSSTLSNFMFFSFSSFFFVFFFFFLAVRFSSDSVKNRVHKGKGNIKAKVSISDSICQQ